MSDRDFVRESKARRLFEHIYQEHRKRVWAYARSMASGYEAAEDVMADAFLTLARRLQIEPLPDDILGYLLATVRSRVIDLARRRCSMIPSSIPQPVSPKSPDAEVVGREIRERLFEGIRQLDPPLREALALRLLSGLTFEAASQVARIPRGTLESRYEAALERLSASLRSLR